MWFLCSPQRLELTVMSECTLLDNLDILKKNGFEFEIDESGKNFRLYYVHFRAVCIRIFNFKILFQVL